MKRYLTDFFPANKLQECADILRYPRWSLRIVGILLQRVTQFSGLEVGFKIPSNLLGTHLTQWHQLVLIEKLKRKSIADLLIFPFDQYVDEPRLLAPLLYNSSKPVTHSGSGTDFFSYEKALWAAIGEIIERKTLFDFKPSKTVHAPYSKIKTQTFDLYSLSGISWETRRSVKDIPLLFDDDTIFEWVDTYSLTKQRKVKIPLQLVNFNAEHLTKRKEPYLRPLVSTGAAAHRTRIEAQLRGVLELIERDAFMITWLNKLTPRAITHESLAAQDERLQTLMEMFHRYHLSVSFLYLPSDYPVHVVLTVIKDDTGVGPCLSVGASANFNLLKAVHKSFSEAHAARLSTRIKLDTKQTAASTKTTSLGRKDRLLYWCKKEHVGEMNFLFNGMAVDSTELPQYESREWSHRRQLAELIGFSKENGVEIMYTNLMGKDLGKEFDFASVLMFSPQLQPLHLDEKLPFNAGYRLDAVPRKLGLAPAKTKNTVPHPFS